MQAHSHTHTRGGAAQLEVGSLPVSVSWPLALHCYLCLTHCSLGNVPNPTPGPLIVHPSSILVSLLYNNKSPVMAIHGNIRIMGEAPLWI